MYTQGFLWGFRRNAENQNAETQAKNPLIVKNTLHLNREDGGLGLIDYQNKMKAFRILMIYKYLDSKSRVWEPITRYWFNSTLRHISGEVWNNQYPHITNIEDVPIFFRTCIREFLDYYAKHGHSIYEKINSKIIYTNLIKDKNHIPTSVVNFPEIMMNGCFKNLNGNKFLDPYLREFLFKLYHRRLLFKRYKLNINDLLNFDRQRCTLCNISIETPEHLFMECSLGALMRERLKQILSSFNVHYNTLSIDNKVLSNFSDENRCSNIIQMVITLANYTIYKFKLKKFFNIEHDISSQSIETSFILKLKNRIIIDHKRMSHTVFLDVWDPGGQNRLFLSSEKEVISSRI